VRQPECSPAPPPHRPSGVSFGTPLTDVGFSGDVTDVNDGVPPTTDGCDTPFANAAALAGHITPIDRGACTLIQKAMNAPGGGRDRHPVREQRCGHPVP